MQTITLNKENKMTISDLIITTANLEQECSLLSAKKYEREASLIDFESRTSLEKQLQQASILWPDYKELVDKYDLKYASLIKHRTMLDAVKRLADKMTEEDISKVLDNITL